MSALDNNPGTVNYLSPLNFKFLVKKTPNVNWFIQKVNLPFISITPEAVANPFVEIPQPGEHMSFSPLTIEFKIDEQFNNYNELFLWIVGMGKPENYDQFAQLEAQPIGYGEKSDITVTVMDASKNAMFNVVYIDAFPIALGSPGFDTTTSDIPFMTGNAVFKYTYFDIQPYI